MVRATPCGLCRSAALTSEATRGRWPTPRLLLPDASWLIGRYAVLDIRGCRGSLQPIRGVALIAAVCIPAGFAAGVTAATPLTLQARALRTGELPGFTVLPMHPIVVSSAEEWRWGFWPFSRTGDELRRAGFVRGLSERLRGGASGVGAESVVAEFRTTSGAREETANEIASDPAYIAFPVGNIRGGAHGAIMAPTGNSYVVTFSDGRFEYGIFAVFRSSAAGALAKARVIAAARALYRRVHGR